ncbi:FAD/NAD-binding domain-containing protein [Vararia minispora EC-137]|uniref:FAD/NAD-binding domain-containing protein n=1 Tax=Vararia minispora EC-137 TaxID=1314806 RepID=A0ACB8Q6W9_9AGAM|nr:FAD/NAD-binding domain-containing protein [Vararia minispora EC-137]
MQPVPKKTTVLVIGGGPAGSYASSLLAREGVDVTLLEAGKHPREHIGESMLPSMRNFLKLIDLEEKFSKFGFMDKPGAAYKMNPNDIECYTDFGVLGPGHSTWNVIRAQSDELMFRHAAEMGAQTFEETRVESIMFENGGDPATARPVVATWRSKGGQAGEISFDWLVDASGRQGVMSTKYLKNRIFREGLRNIAVYGYWEGVSIYDKHGPRENAPWFEALNDKSGWVWVIPLHNGTHSVGIVMHSATSNEKRRANPGSLEGHYFAQLKFVPGVQALLGDNAKFIVGSIRSTSDFSYHAKGYSGNHFRLVGDAAAFIDPLFSSGCHASFSNSLSAVLTILGSMKGQIVEEEAQSWHDAKVGLVQTRFLMIVLSAYKQMQIGDVDVHAHDLDAPSFRKVFDFFRPVYQGDPDAPPEVLTDNELNEMINFTRSFFTPMTAQQIATAREKVANTNRPDAMSFAGPIMVTSELSHVLDHEDGDTLAVLKRINSLRLLQNETSPEAFMTDVLGGYRANVEKGKMGLARA